MEAWASWLVSLEWSLGFRSERGVIAGMGHRQRAMERGVQDWDLGLEGVWVGPSCSYGGDSKR